MPKPNIATPANDPRMPANCAMKPISGGPTRKPTKLIVDTAASASPGDIVYDYDAAPLLHAFIARAAQPTFYDTRDLDALDDLVGKLTVRWPEPLHENIRAAGDASIIVIES